MPFDSLAFAGFASAAILLLQLVRKGLLRRIVILALNLWFLSTFFPNAAQAIPLASFAIAAYGAILFAERRGAAGAVVVLVAAFAWLKQYAFLSFVPALTFPYVVVGLSYMLFRILHLVVDVGEGYRKAPDPLTYFNYVFFFPTFVSGPIQRSEDFEKQTAEAHPLGGGRGLTEAMHRVILGFLMVAIVAKGTAKTLRHYDSPFSAALTGGRPTAHAVMLGAILSATYMVHLYVGFQGYMNLVIGVARLCGVGLPENFNRPWLSDSLIDFWTRWHITLSDWFKFYVFNPLLKALAGRWDAPEALPWVGAAAYFVTFLAMGIWHGGSWIFVVYGVLLGGGIALNRLIATELAMRLGRKGYKELAGRAWFVQLGRATSLSYLAVSISCFWLTPEEIGRMGSGGAVAMGFGVFGVLTVGVLGLSLTVLRLSGSPRPVIGPGWVGVELFVLIALLVSFGGSAPDVVYKHF